MRAAAMLLIGICGGVVLATVWRTSQMPPIDGETSVLTIEKIQPLASLVTLQVPLSDVLVCDMEGYTGGLRLILIVRGEVEIAVDLQKARLVRLDRLAKRAVLLLPAPTARRPRLDHRRSRIYRIDREGLWQILPGQAGEAELVNRCIRKAQERLAAAASQPEWIRQARRRTETVLRGFFEALGWQIEVRWKDAEGPAVASPTEADPRCMGEYVGRAGLDAARQAFHLGSRDAAAREKPENLPEVRLGGTRRHIRAESRRAGTCGPRHE